MADLKLNRGFLDCADLTDEDVVEALIAGVDAALDHPERLRGPPGTILLEEGQEVTDIKILVSGKVELTRRTARGELLCHLTSTGRIIGLMALAQRRSAMFNSRAVSDVTYIRLTTSQLDTAFHRNPSLAALFDTALVRTLAQRERRATALQVEVRELNHSLAQDRDALAEALAQIEKAELRLVESERMAVLGQMCAGIAHELNNPITAIRRGVDHLFEDLVEQLGRMGAAGEKAAVSACLHEAFGQEPLSTREERVLRRQLADLIGDADLARRLIRVGVHSADDYRSRFAALSADDRARRLAELESYQRLASTLRNLTTAADRVTGLVKSLRSYARADQGLVSGVNLNSNLEDSLALFNHELIRFDVQRRYGDIPTITCQTGEIGQIWTNLISNAIEATGAGGTLTVETDTPAPATVRVRLTDSGRGIPAESLERVFELNYTTRQGASNYGLGIGLAICKQIVSRHHGTISVESRPGRTCFSVTLPVQPPGAASEEDRS